jgi:hypothetical protein
MQQGAAVIASFRVVREKHKTPWCTAALAPFGGQLPDCRQFN